MGSKLMWAFGTLAIIASSLLAMPRGAGADPPDLLFQSPEGQTSPGQGAGELDNPRGIAAEANTGHIYIADRRNARVSEYTAWGLFVKSWGWGVADGSAEWQTCGPTEPEEDPDPSLCRKGITGTGRGQMALLTGGMAVDPAGSVWVGDLGNRRVQKFSSGGVFQLMFGGDVNKTKVEEGAPAAQRNLCPVDPADVCQGGVAGDDPGELSASGDDYIAYSPLAGGTIVVGDTNGIQLFNLDGTYRETIAFSGALGTLTGHSVNALDVDHDGNIYFSLSGLEDVYKIDSVGTPLSPGIPGDSKFDVGNPLGVAVDVKNRVYAIDDPPLLAPHLEPRVLVFDAAGNKLIPTNGEEEAEEFFPYVPSQGPNLSGLATNFCEGSEEPGNLFISFFIEIFPPPRSYVNAYGTPPIGCEDPPKRPPDVPSQFAVSVGREEATVKAQINPRFWPDTSYSVEYGTGKCSEGGCSAKAPIPAALLTDKSINASVATVGVVLDGLVPATTYHYRFVAESGGGGPVFGVDPDGREGPASASFEEGLGATFRTFRHVVDPPPCPNGGVRSGESAKLPDCRAYEMVSPLDKGGGDVALWESRNGVAPSAVETNRAALSGARFTYTAAFAFGEPESAPWNSQYLAERFSGGWLSQPISPPQTESPVVVDLKFDDEFQGFTEDLCKAWIRLYSTAPLSPEAVEEYPNVYRRENCSEPPAYMAVTTMKPEDRSPGAHVDLTVKGFSADGSQVAYAASGKLLPEAPELKIGELLLYEHTPDGLRFVCYLPNGEVSPEACAAGTLVESGIVDLSSLHNAVSVDGSRIFWSAYSGDTISQESRPGKIYVRIDGTETRPVSGTVTSEPAIFWTAAPDGSKAILKITKGPLAGNLYQVDVDTETPTLIAGEVEGPMGASEDASRIYFASKEDLDDAGPATAGDHNLYLYEAGSGVGQFSFVMDVPGVDIGNPESLGGPVTKPVSISPGTRSARISPDGLHAVFMSVATPTPTGYDNRDANTDQAVAEVYLYDAVEDELRCVSCNPSGARPTSDEGLAARIQGWELRHHAPRVLSNDGTRVFFESFEALVPRDTNSNWDVYQWEELGKGGVGGCTEDRDTFVPESGGCVDLISSGLSSAKSTFLDADPSGDNVFFSTQSSLVKADYGLNDVYVARALGGFPEPLEEDECEGEACQSPPPPPPEITPSTELSSGPGNEPATKQRQARKCPKGKRRIKRAGKVRCVKRKANKTRRAGR